MALVKRELGRGSLGAAPALVVRSALVGSVSLLLVRWYAAHVFGYGDAEALYALYARHPQAVYVDHPGLVGLLARVIGAGDVPSPRLAHLVTGLIATLAPWFVALVARMLCASWRGAVSAALIVLVTPMTAVGLYALTPDLPLFFAWYLALGAGGRALLSAPGSLRALGYALAAGFATGLAFDAKASGALLGVGLAAAGASKFGRPHLRTIAPYAAVAIGLLVASPVIRDEVARAYPMLQHRWLDPHASWGPSARNLGALVGGQLLYLSPVMCLLALWTFRHLHITRRRDAISTLLWSVTIATLPLMVLCLLSRVAEPHWPAPCFLALPLHFARQAEDLSHQLSRKWRSAALVVAAAFTLVVHLWVLLPIAPWITPSAAKYDLANDLVAWRAALPVVRQALRESTHDDAPLVVVAPHWTLCAQLGAGLPRDVLVGCNSPAGDDWDAWLPRRVWQRAPIVLYVEDSRAETSGLGAGKRPGRSRSDNAGQEFLASRVEDAAWTVPIVRGGLEVRTVWIRRLVPNDVASRGGLSPWRPRSVSWGSFLLGEHGIASEPRIANGWQHDLELSTAGRREQFVALHAQIVGLGLGRAALRVGKRQDVVGHYVRTDPVRVWRGEVHRTIAPTVRPGGTRCDPCLAGEQTGQQVTGEVERRCSETARRDLAVHFAHKGAIERERPVRAIVDGGDGLDALPMEGDARADEIW